MWVDPPEFRDYVEGFTRNLAYHGIDRVVFVNAHGGVQHLREVGRRLHEDETAYAIEWMWDESIPELVDDLFEHNGPHAGPKETAMITHIARSWSRRTDWKTLATTDSSTSTSRTRWSTALAPTTTRSITPRTGRSATRPT